MMNSAALSGFGERSTSESIERTGETRVANVRDVFPLTPEEQLHDATVLHSSSLHTTTSDNDTASYEPSEKNESIVDATLSPNNDASDDSSSEEDNIPLAWTLTRRRHSTASPRIADSPIPTSPPVPLPSSSDGDGISTTTIAQNNHYQSRPSIPSRMRRASVSETARASQFELRSSAYQSHRGGTTSHPSSSSPSVTGGLSERYQRRHTMAAAMPSHITIAQQQQPYPSGLPAYYLPYDPAQFTGLVNFIPPNNGCSRPPLSPLAISAMEQERIQNEKDQSYFHALHQRWIERGSSLSRSSTTSTVKTVSSPSGKRSAPLPERHSSLRLKSNTSQSTTETTGKVKPAITTTTAAALWSSIKGAMHRAPSFSTASNHSQSSTGSSSNGSSPRRSSKSSRGTKRGEKRSMALSVRTEDSGVSLSSSSSPSSSSSSSLRVIPPQPLAVSTLEVVDEVSGSEESVSSSRSSISQTVHRIRRKPVKKTMGDDGEVGGEMEEEGVAESDQKMAITTIPDAVKFIDPVPPAEPLEFALSSPTVELPPPPVSNSSQSGRMTYRLDELQSTYSRRMKQKKEEEQQEMEVMPTPPLSRKPSLTREQHPFTQPALESSGSNENVSQPGWIRKMRDFLKSTKQLSSPFMRGQRPRKDEGSGRNAFSEKRFKRMSRSLADLQFTYETSRFSMEVTEEKKVRIEE